MIDSLLYLMMSKPNIMHNVCLCTHVNWFPNIHIIKLLNILFCFIRDTSNLGLWCLKGSDVDNSC